MAQCKPSGSLCRAVDTRAHRLLHCPATEHVRGRWRPLVEPILKERPSWTHAFYATMPPDMDIPNLMFATRSFQIGLAHLLPSLVQGLPRLRFYTDGSCKSPSIPFARQAGFGVVLDTMPDVPDSVKEACLARVRYDPTASMPFVPVATGLVPDEQNINRAELCAIIRAAELAGPYGDMAVELCSDSAFALAEAKTIVSGGDGLYPDLAPLLREVWKDSFCLRKVRAHADMSRLRGSELWDAAGNDVADQVAKSAVARDFAVLDETLVGIATFCQHQADELFVFAKFLLDMSYEENRLKQKFQAGECTRVQSVDDHMKDTRAVGVDTWVGRVPAGPWFTTSCKLQNDWVLACTWPP